MEANIESNYRPVHFVGEAIDVYFQNPPALEKKPGCPDAFVWREEQFKVSELIGEWHKYERRGRFARNMQDAHLAAASRRGSWGVGQDYFRVRTTKGQIFDIYYDRAPKGSDQRKGEWFIDKEIEEIRD